MLFIRHHIIHCHQHPYSWMRALLVIIPWWWKLHATKMLLFSFLHRMPKGVHWTHWKHWLKEHWCAHRNGDVAASALVEHALTACHGIDLSKVEVLESNHTLQHGICLRVGTFSRMITGSTGNGETFQRCIWHSWAETHHTYNYFILLTSPPPHTSQPAPVLSCTLTHAYPLSAFILVRSNFVIMLMLLLSSSPAVIHVISLSLFKQYGEISLSFTEEGSSWLPKRLNKCFLASVQQVILKEHLTILNRKHLASEIVFYHQTHCLAGVKSVLYHAGFEGELLPQDGCHCSEKCA